MRFPNQRPVRILAFAAVVLLISACGGASRSSKLSSSPAGSATAPPAGAPTAASAATSTTAPATAPTAAPSGPPACRAASLTLAYLGGQGATGHGLLGFSLRNTGARTCHTFGYPGVLFLDRSGAALPTDSSRATQDYFGSAPETRITLAPGQGASFRLGVTHGVASQAGCTTAYGLQVIPPDDTRALRVAIPQGAYECRTATVSPLQPGTTAYP